MINIGYVVLGVFFMMPFKIIYNFDWFRRDAKQGGLYVFYFFLGTVFIITAFNSIIIQILNGRFDYLYLLSIILLFLSGVIFISDMIEKPSKNTLYSLLLGIGVAFALYAVLYPILCFILKIQEILSYLEFIPLVISIFGGIIIGIIFYFYFYNNRPADWKDNLWDSRFLKILSNNNIIIIIVMILALIEGYLQINTYSLLTFFL